MTTASTEWVPLREAARVLGCDDETIRSWIKRGALVARKRPNQRVEVLRSDIDRALGLGHTERAMRHRTAMSMPRR